MDLIPTHQLHLQGLDSRAISRMVGAGDLVRVMRGHYLDSPLDAEELHLARAAACAGQVLALESAALVHGLPLDRLPTLVQVVRPGHGRSQVRGTRLITSAPLPDRHVVDLDGLRLTTRARTVVDLARLRGLMTGLVAWESARWQARTSNALADFDAAASDALDVLARRRGIATARQAMSLASAWSQSPMETRSLMTMRTLGLPEPVQQYRVTDWSGATLGYADFAWPELGVLGEYDGQDKYGILSRPGESPLAVVRREKRRQEGMEALGWVFARWGHEEVRRPPALRARVQAAFAIAATRTISLPGVDTR